MVRRTLTALAAVISGLLHADAVQSARLPLDGLVKAAEKGT